MTCIRPPATWRTVLIFVIVFCLVGSTLATPIRVKRFGEHLLEQAETVKALKGMGYQVVVSVPVKQMTRDFHAIGRKRRSEPNFLEYLFRLEQEDTGGSNLPDYDDDYTQ